MNLLFRRHCKSVGSAEMLRKLFVFFVFFCVQRCETQGQDSGYVAINSDCDSNSGPGICQDYRHCESLLNKEVAYRDLKHCRVLGNRIRGMIVCCPIFAMATTPPPQRMNLKSQAQVWQFEHASITSRITDLTSLGEGSPCQGKSGSGICTRIAMCQAYTSKEVDYTDLKRCTFVGIHEVVCCPTVAKQRPSTAACDKFKRPPSIPHVIGGTNASAGDFPHVGAMLYRSEKAGQKYDIGCGASLISERFALTAAHCVVPNWPEIVRFGSVEWEPEDNTTYKFDAKVKNVSIHDDYVQSKVYHDIALIEFTEKVNTSLFVYYACLYTKNEDVPPSVNLKVAGWGRTVADKKVPSPILMEANFTTVPLDKCKKEFSNDGFMYSYQNGIIDGQYCTLDPSEDSKKDACKGDSGGPLMMEADDCFHIVAIVSFGIGCATDLPSVYTRVSYYVDWIEKIVWPDSVS